MDQRPPYLYEATDGQFYQPRRASWTAPPQAAEFPPRTAGPPAWLKTQWDRLQQEVVHLRHALAASADERERALAGARDQWQHRERQLASEHQSRIETLEKKLHHAQSQLRDAANRHASELESVREQKTQVDDGLRAAELQLKSLSDELKHLAETAVQEQHRLTSEHRRTEQQQHAVTQDQCRLLAEKDAFIDRLQSHLTEQAESIDLWRNAHDDAVHLCETLEQQLQRRDREVEDLNRKAGDTRHRTAEAFAMLEDEIETLKATAKLLRNDHEHVELINACLDLRNDELQSHLDLLQTDLENTQSDASRERQKLTRAIDTLKDQLDQTESRLATTTEEKQSLIESVARLKHTADELGAALFAKDQELDATRKATAQTTAQTTAQLERARQELQFATRDRETISQEKLSLDDQLTQTRAQLEHVRDELAETQSLLAAAEQRFEQTETERSDLDIRLRDFQSAARAAEANTLLRAQEAEQLYEAERDRLETELESLQAELELKDDAVAKDSAVESELRQTITTLEGTIENTTRSLDASSRENDRLQHTVEQLGNRITELQSAVDEKQQQVISLQEALVDAQRTAGERHEEFEQLRMESAGQSQRLSRYADHLATQQNQNQQLQQQLDQSAQLLQRTQDTLQAREEVLEQTRLELQQTQSKYAESLSAGGRDAIEQTLDAKWKIRVSEIEAQHLRQRERDHQANATQQKQLETLTEELERIVKEKHQLTLQLEGLRSDREAMQEKVFALSTHADPIAEVKRLTSELSRRTAEHAREREFLFRRIEQLQIDRNLWRAA